MGVLQMPQATKTEQPDPIDQSARERDEQEIRLRKEEASFHWKQIKQASILQSRNSLRIGFHAFAIKTKNLWGMLGLKDEREAQEASGVKDSTWYNVIRLAESFNGLPEELFTSMKLANCSELADLPESKRLDREWVGWAADESMRVFADRVAKEMNGKARDSDGREHSVSMKLTMPASRRTVIEAGAKKFAERHGMDTADVSKAIEVMVVEQSEGETLIGAITTAVAKIKEAKEFAHSGLSADEALGVLDRVMDEVILDFAHALEQASQRGSEAA